MKAKFSYPVYDDRDGIIGSESFIKEVASVEEALAEVDKDDELYLESIDGKRPREYLPRVDPAVFPEDEDTIRF